MARMVRLDEMGPAGFTADEQVDALRLAVAELGVQIGMMSGYLRARTGPPPVVRFDRDGMIMVPAPQREGEVK